MTIEKLRQHSVAQPFRPFILCLADRREIPVPSPEFLWLPPESPRTFYVSHGGTEAIVDLLMVVSIEFRNGHSKRRKAG